MKCWRCGGHMSKCAGTAICDSCGRTVQYGQGRKKTDASLADLFEVGIELATISLMQKGKGPRKQKERKQLLPQRRAISKVKVVLGIAELICIIVIALIYYCMVRGVVVLEGLGAIVLIISVFYVILSDFV